MGGNTEGSSSNVSGASGVSATRDDKSLVGGVDGTLGEAKDGGGWQRLTWCRKRLVGLKVWSRRKGGRVLQAGDRDGAVAATQHNTANSNSASAHGKRTATTG